MMPCKFLKFQLTTVVFAALTFAGCNDNQGLESGDKDDEEKSQAQKDAEDLDGKVEDFQTNSAMSGSQDPALDDEENRIATQPANVSGAFLTTKVLKVEDKMVYVAAGAYNKGVLVHDRAGIDASFTTQVASVEDIKWSFCEVDDRDACKTLSERSDIQRSTISFAGDLAYSAVFKIPVLQGEGVILQAEYSGYIVKETSSARRYSFVDSQCMTSNCEMTCDAGTEFHHYRGHVPETRKYKVKDGPSASGVYHHITRLCAGDSSDLLLGSVKVEMGLPNLEPINGWNWTVDVEIPRQVSAGTMPLFETALKSCRGVGVDRMIEDYVRLLHQWRAQSLPNGVTVTDDLFTDHCD